MVVRAPVSGGSETRIACKKSFAAARIAVSVPSLSIKELKDFHSFISLIFWAAEGSGIAWLGSGVMGALYCEMPAAELYLDWSKPFVPPNISIGSDAGDAAIVTGGIGYGAYFAVVAEPVGLVCELLSSILCWVT